MTQNSPELIDQTISIFRRRCGGVFSHEDARQALENISGFFRILQEWAEAEDKEVCEDSIEDSGMATKVVQ